MTPVSAAFIAGMISMCFIAIGLCFLRFWTLHRDGLFIAFAIAFWLLALNQAAVGVGMVPSEERSWMYLVRVAAFLVIAVAIVRKNIARAG